MKKKLENIVQDIYKALKPLSKGNGLKLSDEDIDQFGEDMKEAIRGWATAQPKDKPTLRMSNIGKPARQLWYDRNSKIKANSTKTKITAKEKKKSNTSSKITSKIK